jgi:membrane protein DedA with SNARE-associated domain
MENWILQIMQTYGYIGTFLLILIENLFPPIPSELILAFGGYLTTTTDLTIVGMIISSSLGAIVGAIMLYGLGLMLSVEKLKNIIIKFGPYIRLKYSDVERAMKWFDTKGMITVFFCRMIPVLRSLISIPAGMAKMKLTPFLFYTTLGTIIWNTILVYFGALLGANWKTIVDIFDAYSTFAYIIMALGAVTFVIYWFRYRK